MATHKWVVWMDSYEEGVYMRETVEELEGVIEIDYEGAQ